MGLCFFSAREENRTPTMVYHTPLKRACLPVPALSQVLNDYTKIKTNVKA